MRNLFEKSTTKRENNERINNYFTNYKEAEKKIEELETALYDATISGDWLFNKKEVKKNNKKIASLKEQLKEAKEQQKMLINDYNLNLLAY